ncbi:hypothetical protein Terro_3579 [Terriglobus roseus DSM 18391]|uniref:Uncharacterized protein n=1 Tax=Terriglobus roseus (strain DSM 18391 / NRRL B-41598 / KBS 63) TaxID=926566 RepID=I3ZKM5_TERRK|nr:hypothetical protein [Terriglobus roseus]AFL89793.1 hypothetical protein Terro_3579 [Terriglobus roseus DSM 18391]
MSALKAGTEDRKKLIAAGAFGVLALGYLAYTFLGSSSSSDTPASTSPVITTSAPVSTNTVSPAATATARIVPSKLDPTLHPEGMLLSESLVYGGHGRNIFAAPGTQTEAAAPKIPAAAASPRYVPPTPVNTGPPPPPPIDLRFFGTATRRDGKPQAFLLRGEDVFVAGPGDIVSRRYRVDEVSGNSVLVTDLTNNNQQRLPMSPQ